MGVKTNTVLQKGFTLTTSGDAVYTASGADRVAIDQAVFTNTSGGPVNITAHVLQSGETASNENIVISNQPLAADESFVSFALAGVAINNGGSIYCTADTNSAVNVVLYGTVYTS